MKLNFLPQLIIRTFSKNFQEANLARALILYILGFALKSISLFCQIPINSLKKKIKIFKKNGFPAFSSEFIKKNKRGRKPILTSKQKEEICEIAKRHPFEYGLPQSVWSLRDLRKFLIEEKKFLSISVETLRKILLESGLKFRKSKGRKRISDPHYDEKLAILRQLIHFYQNKENSILVFVDETKKAFKNYGGRMWSSCRKLSHFIGQNVKEVASIFLSYDLKGKLSGLLHQQKVNSEAFCEWIKYLVDRYIKMEMKEICIVMDNASYHVSNYTESEIERISKEFGIEIKLCFLPKQSPWLNPCESYFKIFKEKFLAFREFASMEEVKEVFFGFLKFQNKG